MCLPAGALRVVGEHVSVTEIVVRVARDAPFCRRSGGVMLSGGEPLVQPRFERAAAERRRDATVFADSRGYPVGLDDAAGRCPCINDGRYAGRELLRTAKSDRAGTGHRPRERSS